MACGQCSSGSCGSINPVGKDGEKVAGCSSGGCSSGGCTKMNSFDWLANMGGGLAGKYNVIEVKFKGGRKEYFVNKSNIELFTGDFVVCEMTSGYHIGAVSLQGDLVRLQLLKKGMTDSSELRVIHRLANEKDLEKHSQAINRDLPTMYRTREICKELKLNLKLSEVEFQSDNTKATFYYSADDRVDFRELIKMLAAEFKVRVEMRQISLRQEAGRLGGIGSCGRELCCSTWLTDFKAIPTAAARYQNLSLNPAKLSGQCGRLKCCLNYELETYIDAIKGIPSVDKPLKTEKGNASLQKTDIFRRIMWFSYPEETNWHPVSCEQVIEILKMNAEGKKPMALENLEELENFIAPKVTSINTDLDRLDKKYDKKKAKKKKPQAQNIKPVPNKQSASPAVAEVKEAPKSQIPNPKKVNINQQGATPKANTPRGNNANKGNAAKPQNQKITNNNAPVAPAPTVVKQNNPTAVNTNPKPAPKVSQEKVEGVKVEGEKPAFKKNNRRKKQKSNKPNQGEAPKE